MIASSGARPDRLYYSPVPLSLIFCGLLVESLSVTKTAPVLTPFCVGVKVTSIVQLACGAKACPQLLVCAKSPLATMLAMVNVALPLLVIVAFCGGLVVPTRRGANCRLPGEI